jgi:hypothetical protein
VIMILVRVVAVRPRKLSHQIGFQYIHAVTAAKSIARNAERVTVPNVPSAVLRTTLSTTGSMCEIEPKSVYMEDWMADRGPFTQMNYPAVCRGVSEARQ